MSDGISGAGVSVLPVDAVIQHGLAFNVRAEPMPGVAVREAIRALFEELRTAQVDYLLVGGVALLAHIDGRNTQDIDMIVAPEEIGRVRWQAQQHDHDFASATYCGVAVDLLLTTNPVFAAVWRQERMTVLFAGHPVTCATRVGLLVLKLYALPSLYRQGNLARAALYETDILMLLQGTTIDAERLLDSLCPHLSPSDIEELRRILAEQRERRRFGR